MKKITKFIDNGVTTGYESDGHLTSGSGRVATMFERLAKDGEIELIVKEVKADITPKEKFDLKIQELIKEYSQEEIFTLVIQVEEAKAFISGSKNTPLLDAYSETSGVSIDSLAKKILKESNKFYKGIGYALGERKVGENV